MQILDIVAMLLYYNVKYNSAQSWGNAIKLLSILLEFDTRQSLCLMHFENEHICALGSYLKLAPHIYLSTWEGSYKNLELLLGKGYVAKVCLLAF